MSRMSRSCPSRGRPWYPGSFCLLFIVGCAPNDVLVTEYTFGTSDRVTVLASGEWERNVPLYLEVKGADGWGETSGTFGCCSPEIHEARNYTAAIRPEVRDGLYLVWSVEYMVLPIVAYGYTGHVMDFPGTINNDFEHFMHHVLDITKSLAYHGFKKIILLNGHGSNMPNLDLVARRTNLETDAECVLRRLVATC